MSFGNAYEFNDRENKPCLAKSNHRFSLTADPVASNFTFTGKEGNLQPGVEEAARRNLRPIERKRAACRP